MMKMYRKLLRMVSVFFVVLSLFSSCGIATIFNIDATVHKGDKNGDTVFGNLTISDPHGNLSLVTQGTGPSLMLGYIVTNAASPPNVTSSFDSTYRRNIYNGVRLQNQEIISITNAEQTYRLHLFSDSSRTEFRTPYYLATADNPISAESTVRLTRILTDTDPNRYELQLSFDAGVYTPHVLGNLRRYDGTLFTTNQSVIVQSESYPDYTITQEGDALFLHVFAAFTVDEGLFSNIYWTRMTHLGYIELL